MRFLLISLGVGVASVAAAIVVLALLAGRDSVPTTSTAEPLIGLRALPHVEGASSTSHIDPGLSEAARRLINGRIRLEVRCWSNSDWPRVLAEQGIPPDTAGFVNDGRSEVHLAPDVCRELAGFLSAPPREASLAAVESLGILAHEIGHLSLTGSSEAATECYAMQRIRPLAELLGARPSDAAQIANRFWTEIYPQVTAEYKDAEECRNGGAFDLDRNSNVWP